MFKKISVILIGVMLLTGCQSNTAVKNNANESPNLEVVDVLPVDPNASDCQIAYDVVGEIIEMEDNTFHILSGDIVERYQVSEEAVGGFFIGDRVGLALNGAYYEVYLYDVSSTLQRYTTMGDPIKVLTGVVASVSETSLEVMVEDMVYTFDTSEKVVATVGDYVTVDFVETLEGITFLDMYNENGKLTAEILGLEESDSGVLLVKLGHEGEVSYIANLENTWLNVQRNELEIGDTVEAYFDIVAESYPAQIWPKKMNKLN